MGERSAAPTLVQIHGQEIDGTDLDSGADFSPRPRHTLRPRGLKPKSTDKEIENVVSINAHTGSNNFVLSPFG